MGKYYTFMANPKHDEFEQTTNLPECKEENFDYAANLKDSEILQFYAHKSVFITGATGFLGGVVLEKLLYACEEVKRIYILIRIKEGETLEKRLNTLMESAVFERVKKEKKESLKKIIPIAGDVTLPEFDMTRDDKDVLCNEVSIVLHMAASVNFDSTLEDALDLNTKATQNVVKFCKTINKLDALVYTSTAYSNSNRDLIDETVYSTGCSLDAVYHMVETSPKSKLTMNLMGNRPNTYTFAKALAEEYVESEKYSVPASIVRPSVIISAVKEPTPGWVTGINGANGIILAMGQGILRSWWGSPESVADLIPVDVVSNMVIAAGWDTKRRRDSGETDVKVFNCCSGLENPITVNTFLKTSLYYCRKHLFDDVLWYPSLWLTKKRWLHAINVFFLHMIPAFFLDFYLKVKGQRPKMVRIQKKIWRLTSVLEFFTWHQYTFVDYNARSLYSSMSTTDQKLFNFSLKRLNWDLYIEKYIVGLRNYVRMFKK